MMQNVPEIRAFSVIDRSYYLNIVEIEMRFVYIITGTVFLLSACRQREPDTCDGGGIGLPVCDLGELNREDLEAMHKLSNEIGDVVHYTRFGAEESIVRIKLKETDIYLDPCNLLIRRSVSAQHGTS